MFVKKSWVAGTVRAEAIGADSDRAHDVHEDTSERDGTFRLRLPIGCTAEPDRFRM